ncbi:DUF6368 family protein [Hahella aquimaris]|uniref:DUF6368 family protein n=1 Tax=Hahella sp. HNIBRBA332 TaxID=3015983 RepID=UPI00273C0A54|nr:DUF6368 family protein [Hahella sp. HNIBRBA332]WLQ15632.1 DUF6368 family protein [Hahella sp. HNIBRBA332]
MGPSAFIIFENKPSSENSSQLEEALIELGHDIEFGFIYPGDEYWCYEEDELELIKEKTSMSVCGVFEISCPSNSASSHRDLGQAALIACEYLSGLVDFNGAIIPELPRIMYKGMWLWEKANWADVEPYFLEMVKEISGKVYTIEYETANNRIWAHHICDKEFMANWLKHPMFRMIK